MHLGVGIYSHLFLGKYLRLGLQGHKVSVFLFCKTLSNCFLSVHTICNLIGMYWRSGLPFSF